MEMTLEGSNSAETSPPRVGGVRLHHFKYATFHFVWHSTLCASNSFVVTFLLLRLCVVCEGCWHPRLRRKGVGAFIQLDTSSTA